MNDYGSFVSGKTLGRGEEKDQRAVGLERVDVLGRRLQEGCRSLQGKPGLFIGLLSHPMLTLNYGSELHI